MISESVFRQESICEPGSDILPKRKDIRTKFGCERVIGGCGLEGDHRLR